MYLTFTDLANLFADRLGADEPDFLFRTVTDQAGLEQTKGLFLSFDTCAGGLNEAISNGAIAAVWEKGTALPSYTPGQFPVFFTDDIVHSVSQLIRIYVEKLDGENDKKMDTTRFHILNNKLLNENDGTYDIAVMLERIVAHGESDGGRG